jgi:hypothetical protein
MSGGAIFAEGAFMGYGTNGQRLTEGTYSSTYFDFNTSRVVLTGTDVAGINISTHFWRRVA